MGWFWGSSDSNDGNKSQDPLRDLDPSLRDFLAKESPVKYSSSNPTVAPASVPAPTPSPASKPIAPEHTTEEGSEPKVPPQSLFKDGRYAHLWKTYQSQAETEAAGKSDQEKINDVLEGYKYRKAEIGRAALENCALEQWQVNECFRNGGWASRLTMCRTENRELERCYLMQSKFLKALGYLSTFDRPPELDERIQMHADSLYHRMLEQEKAIEAAKAEGRPVPSFPPLLSSNSKNLPVPIDESGLQPSDLKPKIQKGLKKRLEGLKDDEREVEERAIKAEIQAGVQVAEQLGSIYEKQAEERRIRKEQGKETIGDKITSIFSFR
ncbi:uncharacterized protein K444DRAFT_544942 [Hyaloscypha bicolor E]|uniref:Autophagy protein n=1 Tax=Hyaloscypha bicolor E TaxID=1095630 RepID=A0A2J6SJH7_9HELO|nr:uncharacterized protein K444DRAFT_544942 [Hyaloscypha bicolor E]PMD50924.1 hypothetical protein K444DRAFT_544942 [Hyaloscypha bicolor E]